MHAKRGDLCRRLGVVQSMGRVGCALDNAAAEAFNSTLKVEYVHRHRFRTRAETRLKIAAWIADFYNTTRRHSANDGLPPNHIRTSHDRQQDSLIGPAEDRCGIGPSLRFQGIDITASHLNR
ncbi:integrase core domain-containing protein [Nonomuraea sp. NPDC005983]|uniref:integrase core domain-containing protein n=1 Tax=Nonomuraea sp. NPDC005983 TaxID=3155595 RepID=UPI0033B6E026